MNEMKIIEIIAMLRDEWLETNAENSSFYIEKLNEEIVTNLDTGKIIFKDDISIIFSFMSENENYKEEFEEFLQEVFEEDPSEILSWQIKETEPEVETDEEDDYDDYDDENLFAVELVLDLGYVVEKREDEVLPIDKFISKIEDDFIDITVKQKNDFSCEFVIDYYLDARPNSYIEDVLKELEMFDKIEKLTITPQWEIDMREIHKEEEQNAKEKLENAKVEKKTAQEAIDKLLGAKSLKDFANETALLAPQLIKHKTEFAFLNRCLLYSIGDSCGLTSQLKLIKDLLEELNLMSFCNYGAIVEKSISTQTESIQGGEFDPYKHFLDNLDVDDNTLICVDISNKLHAIHTTEFRKFLCKLKEYNDENYIVFRIPFVDDETRAKINSVLSDVFNIKEIVINPYTVDEFKAYAKTLFTKNNFKLTDGAWEKFELNLIEEKQDDYFYNFASVKKITEEFLLQKHLCTYNNLSYEFVICKEDLNYQFDFKEEKSGMEQLDELVGMDYVKERIIELVDQLEYSIKNKNGMNPCLHMKFIGNPGTGKTTVARILGKILKERNLLSVGRFYEHFSRDLCGRYIGETAPKTSAICRDAYGSVLFIDEAYSLFRGEDNDRDFGVEAIDTLIAQMENHRNDFMVIMAGYQDDMKLMLDSNLGLASRIPHTVNFPNYDRKTLSKIFLSMAGKNFKYDSEFENSVKEYFNSLSDDTLNSKDFSNARFVRNLFERTWGKASTRIRLEPNSTVGLISSDFNRAIADREFKELQKKQKSKQKIGF